MPPIVQFNPMPTIRPVALADGGHCYVIDDALREPERLAAWARERREAFREVDFNAYPGTYLLLPDEALAAMADFFMRHLRPLFDARRLMQVHARLAMVTRPPDALRPCQWLCHSDRGDLAPWQSIQASVLYLFQDEALGGTSFYRPARPLEETARVLGDANVLDAESYTRRYGIRPGYIDGSNDYFALTGRVPARFNRMVAYDGSILHSGHIPLPHRLSADPAAGRLTLNGFYTCRRRAA